MTDQQPILIAGPPRCGTTMLAGLILAHEDVWVGRARTTRFPGTNPELAVENQDIKNIMKRIALNEGYRNWRTPLPFQPFDDDDIQRIKTEIEELVPEERRWLVKTSWTLTFHEFWNKAYPDALWVLPLRTATSILDSMQRHPGMRRRPANMRRRFIIALQERQDSVKQVVTRTHGVYVHKLSTGDVTEAMSLMDFLNIPFDLKKTQEWIQPGRMKG